MGVTPPAPFVVGVARSGTTLLRLMLDAHPELAIPPETHFAPRLAKAWAAGPDPTAAALDVLRRHPSSVDLKLDVDALAGVLAERPPGSAGDVLRAVYRAYAALQGKPRWGDKTPPYVRFMPMLAELLPEARFVHIIRDGRDVAMSLRGKWFGPDAVDDLAWWWRRHIERARRVAGGLPGYLEVRYEALVRDPEVELRRVGAFVELAWSPAMLDYHRRARGRLEEIHHDIVDHRGELITAERRLGIHLSTTRPPDPSRIGAWRAEMPASDQRRFVAIAGHMLEELGYGTEVDA